MHCIKCPYPKCSYMSKAEARFEPFEGHTPQSFSCNIRHTELMTQNTRLRVAPAALPFTDAGHYTCPALLGRDINAPCAAVISPPLMAF